METTGGNTETVNVNITIEKTQQPDGSTQTNTTATAQDQTTGSGLSVDYNDQSSRNTAPDGTTTGTESSEYQVSNADGTYGAAGGSDKTVSSQAPSVTVEVPLTTEPVENQNTGYGDPVGTADTTGDVPAGSDDGTYDYTTDTVTQQVRTDNPIRPLPATISKSCIWTAKRSTMTAPAQDGIPSIPSL